MLGEGSLHCAENKSMKSLPKLTIVRTLFKWILQTCAVGLIEGSGKRIS